MKLRYCALLCTISLAFGAILDHRYTSRTETKEVIKDRIVTVTHETTHLDGTRQLDSVTTDNRTKRIDNTTTAKGMPSQWRVDFGRSLDSTYSAQVSRRLLGPVWINASGTSRGVVGLGLGIEF